MKKDLLKEIEKLRMEMLELAAEHGIDHPLVLEVSQKLDILLIEFEKTEAKVLYKKNRRDRFFLFEDYLAVEYA